MRFLFQVRACIFLFLLLFLPWENAISKSYEIPIIEVEAVIQPDGSVVITEHRTYRFEGSYSWADYRLPLSGFDTIHDLQVSENDNIYYNENTEEPGTFIVQRSDDSIRLQWFYEAEDEKRTFTISYRLEGALTIGANWSQFFWSYISREREQDTDSLTIYLELPGAVAADSIQSWSRGPQQKIQLTTTANGYRAVATALEEDESVQLRTVFPRSILDEKAVAVTDSAFTLEWARADEQAYRSKQEELAESERQKAAYGKQLIILTIVISIGAFIFFYRKFGMRHSTASISRTETIMIPGRQKPALIGWLLNSRHIGSNLLLATLFDLARRGYFIIKEQEPEEKLFGDKKQIFKIEKSDTPPSDHEKLTEWETDLTDYVSRQIAQSNNRLEELFSGSSLNTSKWFNSWKKKLKTHCEEQDWFEARSTTGVYANLGIQLLLFLPAILALIWTGPVGLLAIAVVAIMLVASFSIHRRTKEGEMVYARWKAYKKGLSNAADHSLGDAPIDKHFIYAIALGLSKSDLENLFKGLDLQKTIFVWFVLHDSSNHSYASAATTFSTLAATGTASFPGASGGVAGTGASAGAAGGGAAGGAG